MKTEKYNIYVKYFDTVLPLMLSKKYELDGIELNKVLQGKIDDIYQKSDYKARKKYHYVKIESLSFLRELLNKKVIKKVENVDGMILRDYTQGTYQALESLGLIKMKVL